MHRLNVFGGVSLEGPGGQVNGPAAQRLRLALLAIIAASSGGAASRDTLLSLLWPESDDERARHALSNALYAIRRALGEVVVANGPELRIDPTQLDADALEFERRVAAGDLEAAAASYAGPLLEGFHLPDNAAFEEWLESARERFRRRHLEILGRLADEAGASGDPAGRARWLGRMAAAEPLSARIAIDLIRALDAAGDPTAALRQARVHATLVARELGSPPDPSVTACAQEIRERIASGPEALRADGSDRTNGRRADSRQAAPRRGRFHWYVPSAAAALLIAILGLSFGGRGVEGDPGPTRLAVLPLANVSGDSAQDYLADAMTELLATELGRIRALTVRSSTSAERFRNGETTIGEIGERLGVDVVLEGSIIRAGERARIAIRLVGVRPERQIWADSFERNVTDVLALQTDVARAVAAAVRVNLTPDERERLAGAVRIDARAQELFLRARYRLSQFTAEDLREAIRALEEAVTIEPGFEPAWADLGSAYWLLTQPAAAMAYDVGMPKARTAALRAIELDPRSVGGNTTLGWVRLFYDFDFAGALESFRQAMDQAPNMAAPMIGYGFTQSALGNHDAAIATIRRAIDVDPLWLPSRTVFAEVLYHAGRFDEADRAISDLLAIEPSYPRALMVRQWIAELMGDWYRANDYDVERIRIVRPAELAAFEATGKPADVLDYWRTWGARTDRLFGARPVPHYLMARRMAWLGDADGAFNALEKAIDAHEGQMALLLVDPHWTPIRGDPRFSALLERLGLTFTPADSG